MVLVRWGEGLEKGNGEKGMYVIRAPPAKHPGGGDRLKRIRDVEGSRGKGSRGIGTRPLAVSGHLTRARGLHLARSRGLGTWMPGDQLPFGRLGAAGGARREEAYISK